MYHEKARSQEKTIASWGNELPKCIQPSSYGNGGRGPHFACHVFQVRVFYLGPHLHENLFQRIFILLGSTKHLVDVGGGHGVVWPTITTITIAVAFLALLK